MRLRFISQKEKLDQLTQGHNETSTLSLVLDFLLYLGRRFFPFFGICRLELGQSNTKQKQTEETLRSKNQPYALNLLW